MELVDIFNKHHEQLNYQKNRKELNEGEYRLSEFIWIINDKDEILIQQRLATAKKCPNMWGTTAGGQQMGETALEAIKRETKEELGLTINPLYLNFIGSYQRFNDYVEVWLYKSNVSIEDLKPDPSEVQTVKWVSIKEFENMIEQGIGIKSGYEIFKMYYNEYYNKTCVWIDGKMVIKDIKEN